MKHQWNCSVVSGVSFFRFAGFPSAGHADLIVENGSLSTPLGAAGTERHTGDAEPAVEQELVKSPPNEWPMMIGA